MKLKTFVFSVVFAIAVAAQGAVITWTNTAGGSWQTAANWDPHQVPASADTALITASGDYTVTLASAVTISQMTLGGATGTQTLAPSGQSLTVTNSGAVTAHGAILMQGSSLAGVITIAAGGTLTFSGSSQNSIYSLALVNNGTVRWNGGTIAIGSTPTTTVANNGLWEVNSDSSYSFAIGGPTPTFVNTGTLRKIGGAGTTSFNSVHFENAGTVDTQNGTMQFNNSSGSILGGTFTTAAAGTINFASGTYTEAGGAFSGAGAARLTGGTLALVNNKLNGLSLEGGNITVASTFQSSGAITDLTINGATLTGTNEVAGTLTVNSGSLSGMLTVRSGGTLSFLGSGTKSLYSLTLNNNGTVQWTGGTLQTGSTPTTIINNAGLWNMTGDNTISYAIGGPTPEFNNNSGGIVRKSAGTGTASFNNLKFTNAGSIDVQAGTIQFNGMTGSILGGTFTAAPGTFFVLQSGTYTENGGVFSGGGALKMTGGTLTLVNNKLNGLSLDDGTVKLGPAFQAAGAITNLTLNGATLSGTNEIAGTLTMTAGGLDGMMTVRSGGTLVFSSSPSKALYNLTLNNNGTVRWQGGTLFTGSTPGTVINNAALWDIFGDDSISFGIGGPTPVFNNTGTLRKSAGVNTTSFNNLQFVNSGLVDVQSGTIQFNGAVGMVLGGTFSALPGSSLILASGTYTENGALFTGGGTLKMTEGTLTLNNNILNGLSLAGGTVLLSPTFQNGGSITNLTLNGATLTGTNTITGTMTIQSGGLDGIVTVAATGTLQFSGTASKTIYATTLINNGTVRWLGGTIFMGATPATYISNAGLWDILGDNSLSVGIGGPTPIFINLGTLRKSSGTGTATFSSMLFANVGTIDVQSGTVAFNNQVNSVIGGTVTVAQDATFSLGSGTFSENGGVFIGPGTRKLAGGTLTLVQNNLTGLSLDGGTVKLAPTYQAAGVITNLTISGATLTGTNEVSGTLTLQSGAIDTILTVRPTGALVFAGTASKAIYGLTLINNGKVQWQGGTIFFGSTPATYISNPGLWEISGDNNMSFGIGGPPMIFSNNGIIRKIAGTGTTTISSLQLINSGLVEAQTGTIQFNSAQGSILGGTFAASAGANIQFGSGSFTENGAVFNGPGLSKFTGGSLSLVKNQMSGLSLTGGTVDLETTFQANGAITNLTLNGSELTGTNEVAGTLTVVSGGIDGILTVRNGANLVFATSAAKTLYQLTLINNGTVQWQAGTVFVGATPTTYISNNGLWDVTGDNSLSQGIGGPTPQFVNNATGIFRKSVGADVTTISAPVSFSNSGLVEAQTGTIRFPSSYTHTVGKLRLSGGRIEANGVFNMASGTLEGNGTFGPANFTGGTISPGLNGPGKISFAGALKLSSGATVAIDAVNTTPGTGHDQIAVTGTVDLGNAVLQVGTMAQMTVGSKLDIIDNDGVDAVVGTFNSFPEASLFTASQQLFRVRYAAGTGNDVYLVRDDGGVRLTAVQWVNGTYQLSGLGTNFGAYTISATSDFHTWTDVGTVNANGGGVFQFTDPQASPAIRFYRSLGPGLTIP
jgi:hypothetical protein